MDEHQLGSDVYRSVEGSPTLMGRMFPSLSFYTRFAAVVLRSGSMARRGQYDNGRWAESSREVYGYLEDVGVEIHIQGLDHLRRQEQPYVIVSNHMSFLETLLLPAMVLHSHPVTFVIKESLLEYPVFKHVMGACNPIAVTRTNPRHDLKVVMTEGVKRLQGGISVVVFPQSTRSHAFKPAQMSSIGVKLAKKAGAAIIPLALKTDALRNGKILKDFGPLDTTIPVKFEFGEPLNVTGKGNDEQDRITGFIEEKLEEWRRELVTANR